MVVRPKIGITAAFSRDPNVDSSAKAVRYIAAIEQLGGDPMILSGIDQMRNVLRGHAVQGLLFSGGGDIDPAIYGGRRELCDESLAPERDRREIELLQKGYAQGIPILCICRGLQVANVALGGTLIEDLRSELGPSYKVRHQQVQELGFASSDYSHEVRVEPSSKLHAITNALRFRTNSMHHQAVRALAPCFTASAFSDDGVVEAIEPGSASERFFIGVQWHPEALMASQDAISKALFEAFLAGCRGNG